MAGPRNKTLSAAERAESMLEDLDKHVSRLQGNLDKSVEALEGIGKTVMSDFNDLLEAVQERNWAAQHPAFATKPEPLPEPYAQVVQVTLGDHDTFAAPTEKPAPTPVIEPSTMSGDGLEPVVSQVEGAPVSAVLTQDEVDTNARIRAEEAKGGPVEPAYELTQDEEKVAESGKIAAGIVAANASSGIERVSAKAPADPFASFK